MKKFVSSLIAFGLLTSAIVPGIAGAQTSLEVNLKLIQDLTSQIQSLQEQIRTLQTQQAELRVSTNEALIEIIQGLKEGSEGDQVTALQTLLAADASLYPEGLITGYYGPMTRRAIQRFQSRHGLEQVGFVGPRTRALLNKWLHEKHDNRGSGKDKKDKDDDDHDEDKNKNKNKDKSNNSAPVISMIAASPTENGATVTWKTDENAIGKVYYGTSNPLDIAIASSVNDEGGWLWNWWFSNSLSSSYKTSHSASISGLSASTTYYFVIESKDRKGAVATSSQQSFSTGSVADTTAPIISAVGATAASTTASVNWTTNESATSKVYYGTSTPLSLDTALMFSNTNLVTSHALDLVDLATSTTYYYIVESKDTANNTATSTESSFVTGS